jgi:Icc-related predicted phosphoesterase
MKVRVLSDLHLEFADWTPPAVDADVVVLAGDIYEGVKGIEWARKEFPLVPVIYVPGNHEYYGRELIGHLEAMRASGRKHGVDLLDGDELVLGGVRFLGATVWTDYELYGQGPAVIRAMFSAVRGMEDHQVIRYGDRALRPNDLLAIHRERIAWLERRLAAEFPGPTVVITHHAPSPRSVARQFDGSLLSPSFASDLSRLMGLPRVPPVMTDAIPAPVTPALWIHEHMHQSYDYVECDTRVVCNPRGYAPYEPNPDFDPAMIVEVTT